MITVIQTLYRNEMSPPPAQTYATTRRRARADAVTPYHHMYHHIYAITPWLWLCSCTVAHKPRPRARTFVFAPCPYTPSPCLHFHTRPYTQPQPQRPVHAALRGEDLHTQPPPRTSDAAREHSTRRIPSTSTSTSTTPCQPILTHHTDTNHCQLPKAYLTTASLSDSILSRSAAPCHAQGQAFCTRIYIYNTKHMTCHTAPSASAAAMVAARLRACAITLFASADMQMRYTPQTCRRCSAPRPPHPSIATYRHASSSATGANASTSSGLCRITTRQVQGRNTQAHQCSAWARPPSFTCLIICLRYKTICAPLAARS